MRTRRNLSSRKYWDNGAHGQGLWTSQESAGHSYHTRTMGCRRQTDARCPSRIPIRRERYTMKLTNDELEFLSACAREWEPACYEMPAHRLQLAHGVAGAQLILSIKAWTESEDNKDRDILVAAVNKQLRRPWSTNGDFAGRLAEASERRTHRDRRKRAPERKVK